MGWWTDLFARRRGTGPRVAGRPPSANGASSFHLRWNPREPGPWEAAEVGLEVLSAPVVDDLYFWALQADFVDGHGAGCGGAHLGLQWHPAHPGRTAANWGGYDAAGRELGGSTSALPSATGNPNTRDFPWRPMEVYVLRIERVGDGSWRGSVRRGDDAPVVVRDLVVPGAVAIGGATTWSEVFAPCDAPAVAVRWTQGALEGPSGTSPVPTVGVTYQSHHDGGCANTDSSPTPFGVVQETSTARRTPQGATIPWP